mmetsp:Transcript_28912/g.42496  ORF Transcript_28912/g.42496 Transcript_28912/m.42496 type:complete len:251 (-) Transcript_28912:1481-2233(-)
MGKNFHYATNLCLFGNRGRYQFNRRVLNIVVRGDHAKIERGHFTLFGHAATLTLLEITKDSLYHFTQVLAKMYVRGTLQPIVIWILNKPTVEERPCDVVDRILHVPYCLRHDLRVEVIMKVVIKMALNWQRVVKEFLQVFLLGLVTENDTLAISVHAVSASLSHDMQEVHNRVVDMASFATVVLLRSHDNNEICATLNLPAQPHSTNDNFKSTTLIQSANSFIIRVGHAFMKKSNASNDNLLQSGILDLV